MFCSNCGKEIPEGADKCPSCGKQQNNIDLSAVANYAGQKMSQAVSGVQTIAKESVDAYKKEQDERKINSLSDIIIDSDEKQIAVMGSSYLDSMLHGGGLSKGFGILTDKRFYFKGKCFAKVAGQHKAVDEEYVVDLEDITATGFVYARRFLLLMLAILLGGGISLIAFGSESGGLLVLGIAVGVVLLIVYWLTKRAVYEVRYEGGAICVDVSKYGGMKEVKAFNKKLRLAKDKKVSEK